VYLPKCRFFVSIVESKNWVYIILLDIPLKILEEIRGNNRRQPTIVSSELYDGKPKNTENRFEYIRILFYGLENPSYFWRILGIKIVNSMCNLKVF